ncbi:MAG: hypothetical protein ACYCPQ_10340 [Elusimicrobiota bacterium]
MAEKETAAEKTDEAKKEFKSQELYVVSDSKPDDKGIFWRVRVAQWTVDGRVMPPRLEKIQCKQNDKGEMVSTRDVQWAVSSKDFRDISAKMTQIQAAVTAATKENDKKKAAGAELAH